MKAHILQSSFITGQLDAGAQGRSETPLYRNGAAQLRNCEPYVSGGVRARRGSRHLAFLPAQAVLAEFAFNLAQSYVAAFTPGRVDFFYSDTGAAAGSVTGCPWSVAHHLPRLRFANLGDVMWVVHEDLHPHEIRRTSTNTWTCQPMLFDGPKGTPTLRYAAAGISVQTGGLATRKITLAGLPTVGGNPVTIVVGSWGRARVSPAGAWARFQVQSLAGLVLDVAWLDPAPSPGAALDVQMQALGLGVFGDERGLSATPPANATNPALYNSTIVGGTPDSGLPDELLFDGDWLLAGHVGTVLRVRDEEAERFCYATVTAVLAANRCRVQWAADHIPTGKATLLWEEQAHSEVRGYYRSVCLYQQRLVFGGTRDAGSALFLSRSGQFRNFGLGEANDTDAIAVQAAGGVRTIRHVVDAQALTVLTENGVSYVPVDKTKPLTPTSIRLEKVAPYGAANVRPGAFDGGLLFVLEGGNAVRDVAQTGEIDAVQAEPVSLPATGFLGGISDAAYLAASNARPEELAFFVNAAGRIVVFHSIRSQKVGAWFEWTTEGSWSAVGVAGQNVFAVATRKPGTWALEVFDSARAFDGSVAWAPANPSFALLAPNLPDGSTVHAVDSAGDYLGSGTLDAGAFLCTRQGGEDPDLGTGSGWCGLEFEWWIDPLPPAIELPDGTLLQRAQRLVRTSLRLLSTESVSMGGDALTLRSDGMELSAVPPPFSGWHTFRHLGWARPGADGAALVPRITRDVPLPVAVLSMKREIKA